MKMNLLLSILLVSFQYGISQSEITSAWAFPIGSFSDSGGEGIGGMDMDHEDNVYAIPIVKDTTDLDPGPGEHLLIPTYDNGAPLVKYDKNGQLVWVRNFIGGNNSYGSVMEVAYNRIIITYSFTDSLIYDNGIEPVTLIHQEGWNVACIFIDLDGDVISSFVMGGEEESFYFTKVITLPDQRILLSGSFQDTLVFGVGAPSLISVGDFDGFLTLLNPDFSVAWARQFGSPGYDGIEDVETNDNGSRIAFSGSHEGIIQLVTINGPITLPFAGEEDGVFGTLDVNGNFLNAYTIGGPASDNARAIDIDDAGNLYVGGYFEQSVNFAGANQAPQVYTSGNEGDGFIAKYSPSGDLQWNRVYTNNDYGGIYTLTLERNNELYASGGFSGRVDLDPGPDSMVVDEGFVSIAFLTKLKIDGTWLWSNWFRSEDNVGIREVVVSTESSRIYIDGFFFSNMNCAVLPDENYIYTHGTGSDAFFAAFDEAGVIAASHDIVTNESVLYPNPTLGPITIQADEEIKELEVLTADGTSIRVLKGGSNSVTFNIDPLPSGIYYVKVRFAGRQELQKVIRM